MINGCTLLPSGPCCDNQSRKFSKIPIENENASEELPVLTYVYVYVYVNVYVDECDYECDYVNVSRCSAELIQSTKCIEEVQVLAYPWFEQTGESFQVCSCN